MKIYLYAKSGHTIGLEATKRCAAIANELREFDPIFCTSDFRAGVFAKDLLGIKKYVNIDVLRNLYNIMERRDILIYDTDEVNELMKNDLKQFCTLLYSSSELSDFIIDTSIYKKIENPKIKKAIFFGDDDYNNLFLELVEESTKYDIELLMGHYFFLGNEKIFKNHFSNIIDEENYVDTILNTKYLLTASLQAALESIQAGNKAVLFLREDKVYNEDLITNINLPVIKENTLENIINKFEEIIKDYPEIKKLSNINLKDVKNDIKTKVDEFKILQGT